MNISNTSAFVTSFDDVKKVKHTWTKYLSQIQEKEYFYCVILADFAHERKKTNNYLEALRDFLYLKGFLNDYNYLLITNSDLKKLWKLVYKGPDRSTILKSKQDFWRQAYLTVLSALKREYQLHFHYRQLTLF